MAIEPMYTLEVAAELIPLPPRILKQVLDVFKDQFPLRYHTMLEDTLENKGGARSIRMLTESECLRIRELVIKDGRSGDSELRREVRRLRAIAREGTDRNGKIIHYPGSLRIVNDLKHANRTNKLLRELVAEQDAEDSEE